MLLFTNWLHHATPGRWEDLASKARGWRISRSLPKIRPLSEDPSTVWRAITASNWYGKEKRSVEVVSDTAVWHSTGLPAVPLRAPLRPPSRVQDPGAPLHRSSWRAGADHLLVRDTLVDGNHLSRSTPALRLRDSETLVWKSDPEDRSCAVGFVLCGQLGFLVEVPAHPFEPVAE
jgi:hypothetical protein